MSQSFSNQAHFIEMQKYLIQRIKDANGWIPFHVYMDSILYAPKLGYYSAQAFQFGATGDFITAPELGPLFGQTLAHSLDALFEQTDKHVLEVGAGSGQLARVILDAMPSHQNIQYDILELSAGLRQKQKETLSQYSQVRWLTDLPSSFKGVVIANEVLDAMPVHLVRWQDGRWYEVGVQLENEQFVLANRDCSENLLDEIRQRIADESQLPNGYLTEIHCYAQAWVRTICRLFQHTQGAIVLIDYGFPKREYYLPQRSGGTLMCHYKHQASADVLARPGQQDVTTHVDFTTIAQTAMALGMDVLCYTNQANFLLGSGVLDVYEQTVATMSSAARINCMNELQKLLSPAEMGELFKVLVLGHNITPPDFMMEIDKSGRL